MTESRPPFPRFDYYTAVQKVQAAQDNDVAIAESGRRYFEPRLEDERGLDIPLR
ncbi:hypothetical protein [Mycolicibacterium aromaticivorans]|uniref:hypothetical protein n=1 Tax=Mycolicibacterium aromaticivorans TaxID=318425 RepID=UPI000451CC60|nr:hypothetical protein [Mycolicibacterium aromaticivorans]